MLAAVALLHREVSEVAEGAANLHHLRLALHPTHRTRVLPRRLRQEVAATKF